MVGPAGPTTGDTIASSEARPHTDNRTDPKPAPIGELIGRLGAESTQTVTFRDGPDGEPVTSRFIFARYTPPTDGATTRDGRGGARAQRCRRARNG